MISVINEYSLEDIDWWLNNLEPSIEHAVVELNNLRAVEKKIRLAKAHIEYYVRDKMDLSEFDPDPEILKDPNDWEDD